MIVLKERLILYRVSLNKNICEFKKESLDFLGHKIDKSGISADPNKIMGMLKMETPKTRTELRRFLGMVI